MARICLFCAGLVPAAGQVLARPGWAGSGVVPEAWWRRAVFYRIDPTRFQDSDDDGTGDLPGITLRLDYLQSLGVDALVLDGASPATSSGSETLDDLIREASRRHLRLLMTVTPGMQEGDRAALMNTVQRWLSAGAAGVWVPKPSPGTGQPDAAYAGLLSDLSRVLRSLPGERVLLADPAPGSGGTGTPVEHGRARASRAVFAASSLGRLTVAAALPMQSEDAAALRQGLQAVAGEGSSAANPLLRFAEDPATASPNAVAEAALLLGSRGAAMIDFGDEIGLDAYPPGAANHAPAAPVMQWTPVNIQQAPIERPSRHPAPTPPGGITPFGAYRPYVRPPRTPGRAVSAGPNAGAEGAAAKPPPDLRTLPGFTRGPLPSELVDGARINVATEERDPGSVLNAYRELIALHHENASLRNGMQNVLNRDAQGAVVWVRRAPAGSRTAANVVIAANLGDRPVTLSLNDDLQRLGVGSGALRALFAWSPQLLTGESTGALMLPAHAVFVGEIVRTRR